MSGTITLKGLGGKEGFETLTVTTDVDFSAQATKDVTISIADKRVADVLRGRIYIDVDPTAPFSQWGTITFYNKIAKKGEDAFYRTEAKFVYTELDTATTGSDANIIPDDHEDFSPNDLIYFIDGGSSEFARLMTIAATMVAEDNVAAHAINTGISRVIELSTFTLFNNESGTDIYLRITFPLAVTLSLKVELILRK